MDRNRTGLTYVPVTAGTAPSMTEDDRDRMHRELAEKNRQSSGGSGR